MDQPSPRPCLRPPDSVLPPSFRATVVFIDAKLRPGESSAKNGGRLERSWIDVNSSFYRPRILAGWRRPLRNAAEEGTILRNNSDPPPPRAPIRLYCRGFPRKLAVYFALLRIHDTTMIAPPISVIGPARLNSFSVREAVTALFSCSILFLRIYKFVGTRSIKLI